MVLVVQSLSSPATNFTPMPLYGAVEFGGTKTLVAVGTSVHDLSDPLRIETTNPETTLGSVVTHLDQFPIDSVGIAAFGPIELRRDHPEFGAITSTPKPGWSGTPIWKRIRKGLDVPAGIDTDVNGAALGEGRWGAARGLETYLYVTVGTGIGIGAVVAGRSLHALGHPEMGHVVVGREPGDDYPGRCPFHGDCLEGMACGPALEDRFGPSATWNADTEATGLAVGYLAQGLRSVVYSFAPERIVVGGGVSKLPDFHARLRAQLTTQLAGYPPIPEREEDAFISAPGLGDISGLAGALIIAEQAF